MYAIQTIRGPAFIMFQDFNHSGSTDCGLSRPLRHKAALQLINRLLEAWIVYLILFFMGISFGVLDNLASNLVAIFIIPPSVLRLT